MNLFTSIIRLAEVLLFLSIQTRPVTSQGNKTLQRTGFAPRLTNFKLDVHRLLEGSRIRKKRHIREDEDLKNIDPSNHNTRVGKLSQEYTLSYLTDYNLTFWISFEHRSRIQVLVGTQEGHLILFELSENDDKDARTVALSFNENIAIKAMAFTYFDEQWFVILHSSGDSKWIRFYQKIGRGLEGRQTITLDGETDFDLIYVKGVHYLAVVTFRTSPYQSMLTLYHWTRTQFDKIAARAILNGRSVTCWEMDGNLYMAVAQEMSEEGDFRVGSPVFFYSARDDEGLKLLQMIDTYGPIKVRHFYASGSHYVIIFGRENATIHWWSNDQFLHWQTLERTAYASDASVLALTNGEVMIVITFQEEALFFALDGSGHYILTFAMTLSGNLASLQFMYSGQSYYALAQFQDFRPQSVWKLILDSFYLPTANSFDPLQQCLADVSVILNNRQNNLDGAYYNLGRVWLKDRNQAITSEVIVTGKTSSHLPSIITYVLVVTEHKILPDTSMPLVENAIARIKSIIDKIWLSITASVRKSLKQDILGNKNFVEVISVPSLNMQSTSIDVFINGVYISRIYQFALRKFGNQLFKFPLRIDHIYSRNVLTNKLNGLELKDLLLLRGEQEVTGLLKFSSVMVDNVLAENVNSIPVENLVTATSHQQIKELKSITHFSSRVVDVHGKTNGEVLREFAKRIVLTFGDGKLKGRYSLTSPVEITGDIFLTGLINDNINLDQLTLYSVQKHTEQALKGPFVFTSPHAVLGNLDVAGYINGININQLMTLSTDQTVLSDIVFNELLTINGNLVVDYVNGIDLDEMAVLKTGNNVVAGFVTFSRPLTADSISMTEYVVLDDVDPSLMLQDIINHAEGVVNSNEVSFHNVVVLGHVIATEGINGLQISELPTTVWLRTINQQIEAPVNLAKIVAKSDLEVKRVNNLNLDEDFAHSFKNETILSFKSFDQEVVITEHLNVTEAVVNGFDITSFQKMDGYKEDGTVRGVKTLENLQVFGHVDAKILNNFVVDNIMHAKAFQTVLGEKRFLSELTTFPGDLVAQNVNFNTFNSIDLQKFIDNAVSRTAPKYVIANKAFWNVEAQDSILAEESTLNGINFSQMLNRIVTLNTSQEILSGKRFLEQLVLEKSSTISNLNGESWSNIVNNVVFVDEYGYIIAPKTFNGKFEVGDLLNHGFINGINITYLYENTFFKSGNNVIKQPVSFMENLHIANLQANALIDGLSWDHFIFIQQDESLDNSQFLSDVVLLSNMHVGGLLNGCNITQLRLQTLHANKKNQFVNEKAIVQNIHIIGNLHLKDKVNEIPVEELQLRFITVAGDQIITTPVHVESDLRVAKLNLVDLTNNVNLEEILRDAVRHSFPQEVLGQKSFQDIMADTLTAEALFIIESLDGIDVINVLNNAVMKSGNKKIFGEKIFHSLTADAVLIHGYINGLRLPQDVVLTSTDDHISGHTSVMSDLSLESDVNVFGKIAGVDLNNLIQSRVTLTEEQLVSSSLTFLRDVKMLGDLSIDGTVNDVVLELVCKVNQAFPLEGEKIFSQDISILGSLSTPFINEHDVVQMDRDILRYNRDEFLESLQVFQNTLKAKNSLLTDLINGISLSDIISTFVVAQSNYNITLSYFGDLENALAHQINLQMEASGNQILRFAYFVLVQEINMGSTTRILYGYDLTHATGEFSHSMVIWTTEKQCSYLERCCHLEFSRWMRIKRSGHIMIEGDAEPGRFYPIRNPSPVAFDKNFVIWSNVPDVESKWCSSNNKSELVLASMKESGEMEILMGLKDAPLLSDVKTFRRGHLYAVAGFFFSKKEDEYSSAVVYVFNEVKREWREHQTLPSFGVLSLDITHNVNEDEIVLAIGTGMGTYSSIYKWNDDENVFDLLQNIPPQYVTSTLWLNARFVHLLAMSSVSYWPKKEGDCLEFLSGGKIDIFVYYNNRAKWVQSINLHGVVSMISFTLAGDTFLVAASHQLQSVYVYELKGYAGFSLIHSMFVGEVRHLNAFTIGDNIYMTVAVASEPSKLLKIFMQGKHALPKSIENLSLEQSDEAIHDEKFVSGC